MQSKSSSIGSNTQGTLFRMPGDSAVFPSLLEREPLIIKPKE